MFDCFAWPDELLSLESIGSLTKIEDVKLTNTRPLTILSTSRLSNLIESQRWSAAHPPQFIDLMIPTKLIFHGCLPPNSNQSSHSETICHRHSNSTPPRALHTSTSMSLCLTRAPFMSTRAFIWLNFPRRTQRKTLRWSSTNVLICLLLHKHCRSMVAPPPTIDLIEPNGQWHKLEMNSPLGIHGHHSSLGRCPTTIHQVIGRGWGQSVGRLVLYQPVSFKNGFRQIENLRWRRSRQSRSRYACNRREALHLSNQLMRGCRSGADVAWDLGGQVTLRKKERGGCAILPGHDSLFPLHNPTNLHPSTPTTSAHHTPLPAQPVPARSCASSVIR